MALADWFFTPASRGPRQGYDATDVASATSGLSGIPGMGAVEPSISNGALAALGVLALGAVGLAWWETR